MNASVALALQKQEFSFTTRRFAAEDYKSKAFLLHGERTLIWPINGSLNRPNSAH